MPVGIGAVVASQRPRSRSPIAKRQDVVRADPAEHERVVAAHGQLRGAGDQPPAGRLRHVHGLHDEGREGDTDQIGAPQSTPDGAEVRFAEHEPQEERGRAEPDGEEGAAAQATSSPGATRIGCVVHHATR